MRKTGTSAWITNPSIRNVGQTGCCDRGKLNIYEMKENIV